MLKPRSIIPNQTKLSTTKVKQDVEIEKIDKEQALCFQVSHARANPHELANASREGTKILSDKQTKAEWHEGRFWAFGAAASKGRGAAS